MLSCGESRIYKDHASSRLDDRVGDEFRTFYEDNLKRMWITRLDCRDSASQVRGTLGSKTDAYIQSFQIVNLAYGFGNTIRFYWSKSLLTKSTFSAYQ